MKHLEEYTKEELVSLCRRPSVYATISWFKYYRTYKMNQEDKDLPIIEHYQNQKRFLDSRYIIAYLNEDLNNSFFKIMPHHYIDSEINRLRQNEKNHNKIMRLQFEREAFLNIHHCLWWCGGVGDKYYEEYIELEDEKKDDWKSPEELETELHINDKWNKDNGLATNIDVYKFIWETLQYLNINQLSKLLKFADNGIATKWQNVSLTAGRKNKVCDIQQIDIETGAVINIFKTRNDVMLQTGIKKSHLSQCIKTAKDNSNDRTKWKKWLGSDGKKYGFVELQ